MAVKTEMKLSFSLPTGVHFHKILTSGIELEGKKNTTECSNSIIVLAINGFRFLKHNIQYKLFQTIPCPNGFSCSTEVNPCDCNIEMSRNQYFTNGGIIEGC